MEKFRWQEWLEYMNGCSAEAPAGSAVELPAWAWGLWWLVLLGLIALFCGQSSKFIYIDF